MMALAEYPNDPQHYGDFCARCDEARVAWRVELICKPHTMNWHVRDDGGYTATAFYRCPLGHEWTTRFRAVSGYFSDCMCAWCVAGRKRTGDPTFPRTPFYNA